MHKSFLLEAGRMEIKSHSKKSSTLISLKNSKYLTILKKEVKKIQKNYKAFLI